MSQATVAMKVRQISPAVSIIDVHGAVTLFAEEALLGAYDEAALPTTHTIILNFGGMEYLCSGIGPLITLLIRANRQQHCLLACGLSEHYRDIFSLARLTEVMRVHRNEEEALAEVN
jgi:anti-sigma B factor antagonist